MAKNKLSISLSLIKFIITITIVLAGVLVAWGKIDEKLFVIETKEIPVLKETDRQIQERMEKNREELENDIEQQEAQFHMQNEAIIKLQSDVAYIKEGIDDIKGELRER